MTSSSGFNTRAIHAGQEPDPATGAVIVPLHLTTTYKQDGVGGLRGGYEYSRSGNPTRTALHEALAALEEGTTALAFASGLAAEDTLLRTVCEPGSHVVLGGDAYGGTYRLISKVLSRWGVEHTPADLNDADALRAAMRPTTRVIWCETPSNPLLNLADIELTASVAHDAGAVLVVDNTFASPYLQRPLTLGADVVVHSTTKYLGGHSDVVGGALVCRDAELGERLAYHHNAMGAVASPFDSWIVLRSLKTLGVRMGRHCANAARVVDFLVGHPAVARVLYPGLPDHPGHDIAAKQMSGFGGMVAFRLREGQDAARKVCDRTELFTLAESLGGVESLIEHPGLM
ncbi:MAG: cystathionine gamma-synthase, partial [Actinomycetes bacterium]